MLAFSCGLIAIVAARIGGRISRRDSVHLACSVFGIGGVVLAALALFALAFPPIARVREASPCVRSQTNLKYIVFAMHSYESAKGYLPGPIRDKSGRPLLSVRVALLPYLEHDAMYKEFHLDEPWDSPQNLRFLDRMPSVYRSPGTRPPLQSQTFYRLVTGPRTAFEKKRVTLKQLTAAEGTAYTVFWIEAGDAVPWTKPEEFEVPPDGPLPTIGGLFPNGTNVGLGDGSVKFVSRDTPEATWQKLLRRGGWGNAPAANP